MVVKDALASFPISVRLEDTLKGRPPEVNVLLRLLPILQLHRAKEVLLFQGGVVELPVLVDVGHRFNAFLYV